MSNIEGPTSLVVTFGSNGRDELPSSNARPGRESIDYLRAREHAEKAAAKGALSIGARRAHQELAQYYAELIQTFGRSD
jgi:hypothetical protein